MIPFATHSLSAYRFFASVNRSLIMAHRFAGRRARRLPCCRRTTSWSPARKHALSVTPYRTILPCSTHAKLTVPGIDAKQRIPSPGLWLRQLQRMGHVCVLRRPRCRHPGQTGQFWLMVAAHPPPTAVRVHVVTRQGPRAGTRTSLRGWRSTTPMLRAAGQEVRLV